MTKYDDDVAAQAVPLLDPTEAFFKQNRLLIDELYDAIVLATPLAAHPGGDLWIYDGGVYRPDRRRITHLVTSRLRGRYKPQYLHTFISYAEAELAYTGFDLARPPSEHVHLVNVANGMLDPFTGALVEHDPKYLSVAQLPIVYNSKAKAPRFVKWLAEVLPDEARRATLLEDLGTVVDMRGYRQKKAVFLIGPTRSGKSTMARIIESIVGADNRSTEELVDLATNRFRAARLFGQVLNVASDISAGYTDVGIFKKLAGEDSLTGEHKFAHPFSFRFHGLMVMTMNTAPAVSDPSGAYLQRIRPYRFNVSFAGREDPRIEAAIIDDELSGVLNLLVAGFQRIEHRNGYLVDDAARKAEGWFGRQSDRVRLFLAEATFVADFSWTKRSAVHEAFVEWAKDSKRQTMSRNELYAELRGAGIVGARRDGVDGFKLSLVDDPDTAPEAIEDD